MEEILAFIEGKKQKFAQQPIFLYMQDRSIDPRQRLAWIPCAAPFIMGFADLNKYAFRDDLSNDPIQKIINKDTYEDDHHWMWFLEDLKNLGFDQSLSFNGSLKFLWGEETKSARRLINELYRYAYAANPLEKLIVFEVIEATGSVMFPMAAQVSEEIREKYDINCRYFGKFHVIVESEHEIYTKNTKKTIEKTDFSQYNSQEKFELIDTIFQDFADMTNSFFDYVNVQNKYLVAA
jgi:hypothetical protein